MYWSPGVHQRKLRKLAKSFKSSEVMRWDMYLQELFQRDLQLTPAPESLLCFITVINYPSYWSGWLFSILCPSLWFFNTCQSFKASKRPEKPCLYPALPPLCYFTSWFLEEFQPKNQRSSFELDESHKAKGLIKRNARAVI